MKLNNNFFNLVDDYLFAKIASKTQEYKQKNPQKDVIRMGIGDVTLPLAQTVVQALQQASAEMGKKETFKGYGEYAGYAFLQQAICDYYANYNVNISPQEVFCSDGAKSDLGAILDLFDSDNTVLIPDPVYPVYVDTNIMGGRRIKFIDGNMQNGFCPLPDKNVQADIIYLCSPNNPTGAVYSKAQLKEWVDYAISQQAVILFDAAYEAFVGDNYPHSIFEVEGAEQCAIEFGSLSKTAGFTGTRCGWAIISDKLVVNGKSLQKMWYRRQSTKFNGVSYVIQRGAAAALSREGIAECSQNIEYYKQNARIISQTMQELGLWFTGGKYSPYIWLKTPHNMSSWEFFDFLLEQANVVGTPGAGFGKNGEGFFRLSSFGTKENTQEAMARLKTVIKKL